MSLGRISNVPGSATNAPNAATILNTWADQIELDGINILSNTASISLNSVNITNLQIAVAGLGAGSTNVFLSVSPGIDPNGIIDSNAGIIAAIESVRNTNKTLVWDCPAYSAQGFDNTKTIFIRSNTNIDWTSSGAFITDAIGVPAMAMAGTVTNCTFTDFTVRYTGNPGATILQYAGAWSTNNSHWNDVVLLNYMVANNGNTFTSPATPIWPGPTNTSALFYIGGNVSNCSFIGACSVTSVNPTADRFVNCLFSLNIQWLPGAITSGLPQNATTAAQPSNISFDGIVIDGVCMAWVGTGANLKIRNITRFRYGDLEDSSGNFQGGMSASGRSGNLATDLWSAPPHLFYLQSTNTAFPCSVDYFNIFSQGLYTSNNPNYGSRRTGLSGYINLMKIDASGLNTIKNLTSKDPDGFCDILALTGGVILPGSSIENVDVFMDCGVGGTYLPVTSFTTTSFSVAPANWVCNQSGVTYAGVNSGSYLTKFSSGEVRMVAYVVTVVGNSATAITATWAKPLLLSNTSTVYAGLTNSGRFALRYPGQPAQNVFFKNIKVIDLATLPFCWPLSSDAATNHINVVMDVQVIVQDYPTVAQYTPGFGLAGEGINCRVNTIFSNCSNNQSLRGPIVNNTSSPTNDQFREDTLHGWRQVIITFAVAPTGTSANLIADLYHTGDTGWVWPTGTYNVLFSDNQIRPVSFTNGSVACTWSVALTGTPTVTAQACLINATQFNNFKPRIQLAQTPPNINLGVRARVIDVSNGIELEINQGLLEERWTQFWQGIPSGATPITYDASWAIDRAAFAPTTTLTGGSATAVNLTTGGNTILTGASIAASAPLPIIGPQPYAGVITVAPVSGTLPTGGVAYVGVRGVRVGMAGN